jgi:hypothetical protein
MVGGRRRNPRARQGADVKIGPAARNSFSRMPGSWFGIAGSRRIRGWQGVRPVCQIGVHRDQHLVLDLAALIRGFRAPALCDGGTGRGSRPKASQGGNRGELEGPFGERGYGDLRIADGCRAGRGRPVTLIVLVGSGDGGRFRWRRCAGARRWPRLQEGRRRRAGVALVFRRGAGGGGDRRCEAGGMATVMRCRS